MSLRSGHRLGPYEILDPIGEGGMGEVYRARDTRLDRTVAVKVLPVHLAEDGDYRQRFDREARAASALNHSNIAQIYDVGSEGGHHFIVMEYVEGENLGEFIKRGRPSVDRIIDLAAQMASALEAAHAKGIIHRDIKSANVVVSPGGQVKVLDFGLARLTRPGGTTDTQLATEAQTEIGVVMGTLPYMSPEQALGTGMDARTDIFSLGIVLHELATGRRPFSGVSATDTINKICNATPEPIHALNPDVPEAFERIVSHCLVKDRTLRYQQAGELRRDLEVLRRGEVLAAQPGIGGSATAMPSWRRRRLVPVAAGVALTVAIAVSVIAWQAAAEKPIDSIAVLPFANESDNAEVNYLSDGMAESLINALSELPNLKVISRTSAFAFKESKESPADIGRKLGVRSILTGRMVLRGDRLSISAELVDLSDERQLWGSRYDRPLDDVVTIERELTSTITKKLRLKLTGADVARLAQRGTDDPRAYQLFLKGRHFSEGTAAEMDRGLEAFQEAVRLDPSYAMAHAAIANAFTLRAMHGTSDPRDALLAARSALDRAIALDADLAEAHIVAGNIRLLFEWDGLAAEAAFRRAVEVAPGSADAHMELAFSLWALARPAEALEHSLLARDLDPLSRGPMHHVGFTYLVSRQYGKAIDAFTQTLDVHTEWVWGYVKRGVARAYDGQSAKALEDAKRAEALIGASGETPLLRSWLGALYARAGDPAAARSCIKRLDEIARQKVVSASDFAAVCAVLGENDKAFAWLEEGLRLHDPNMSFVPVLIFYDGLRDDPRFASVVKRVGLGEKKSGRV